MFASVERQRGETAQHDRVHREVLETPVLLARFVRASGERVPGSTAFAALRALRGKTASFFSASDANKEIAGAKAGIHDSQDDYVEVHQGGR